VRSDGGLTREMEKEEGLRAIRTFCLLVVLGTLGSVSAFAQESAPGNPEPPAPPATEPPAAEPSQPQPEAQPQPEPVPQPSQPAEASPALNLTQPTVQPDKDEPLVEKWWLWTAIGAAVIGTVVAIVLIDGGSSTPRTTLGNQEFRP
jgi:hypothetical protein